MPIITKNDSIVTISATKNGATWTGLSPNSSKSSSATWGWNIKIKTVQPIIVKSITLRLAKSATPPAIAVGALDNLQTGILDGQPSMFNVKGSAKFYASVKLNNTESIEKELKGADPYIWSNRPFSSPSTYSLTYEQFTNRGFILIPKSLRDEDKGKFNIVHADGSIFNEYGNHASSFPLSSDHNITFPFQNGVILQPGTYTLTYTFKNKSTGETSAAVNPSGTTEYLNIFQQLDYDILSNIYYFEQTSLAWKRGIPFEFNATSNKWVQLGLTSTYTNTGWKT